MLILALLLAAAPQQKVVVPALFNLNTKTDGKTYDWIRILQAGPAVKVVVASLDTLGSGTGPGTGPTSDPAAMFDHLRAKGTLVLGYVMTRSASRDLHCPAAHPNCNVIENQDRSTRPYDYSVDQWYAAHGGHIDGIFFDVGPSAEAESAALVNLARQKSYYESLYQTMKKTHGGGCGGRACVMLNASQFPGDHQRQVSGAWVVHTASDFATMWEHQVHGPVSFNCKQTDKQDYFTRFCPGGSTTPAWSCTRQFADDWYFAAANAPRIAYILSSAVPSDVEPIVAKSRSSHGSPGMLYVFDGGCNPKKPQNGTSYDHLSSLFEQLVSALR